MAKNNLSKFDEVALAILNRTILTYENWDNPTDDVYELDDAFEELKRAIDTHIIAVIDEFDRTASMKQLVREQREALYGKKEK